jgi:hypothetical protein
MEVADSTEILIAFYFTTLRHILEDSNLILSFYFGLCVDGVREFILNFGPWQLVSKKWIEPETAE